MYGKEQPRRINIISYIVSITLGIATALLSAIVVGLYNDNKRIRYDRKNLRMEHEEAMDAGLRSILRELLVQLHKEVSEQGYINRRQRERWEELFIAYHGLNGNGMITDMNDEVRELPIK